MGYYAENPYERLEPPRCAECDQFMVEVKRHGWKDWECSNPDCDESPLLYKVETNEDEDERLKKIGLDMAKLAYQKASANGVYCKRCEFLVEYGDMKSWRKDDETIDMLCPGCDSVLVEGE